MGKTLIAAVAWLAVTSALAATPPGMPIANQAQVAFGTSDSRSVVFSNEVVLRTAVLRSASALGFTRVTNAGGGSDRVLPAVCPSARDSATANSVADVPAPSAPVTLQPTARYNVGDTLILRLEDADQNLDYMAVDETELVIEIPDSGDVERIRLTETGIDTGVFTGWLASNGASARPDDCVLQALPKSTVIAAYQDPADAGDRSSATAAFDPTGVTFDSQSGQPLNGVTVRLVHAASGSSAAVFGNDGVSPFPATLVSGTPVTDASGERYEFATGEFRFPVVAAGDYRFEISTPDGYRAPSSASAADLAALPGAPYETGAASYGEVFSHDGNGPFSVDIPLDPVSTELFVSKSTRQAVAAPGDFAQFEVEIGNDAAGARDGIVLIDNLPVGLKLVEGSTRLNGTRIADPDRMPGGALRFEVGSLPGEGRATLGYVVQIVSGADGDVLSNTAFATAPGGVVSNESVAVIRLREDLIRSRGFITGRVVEAGCGQAQIDEDRGVGGVRVYLEDGRYSVTDEGGRYHFEGVPPGTHVAQLDADTVPPRFEVAGCADDPRFAGRGDSRLVDLTAGALQRVDFFLERKKAPEGRVDLSLATRATDDPDRVIYAVELSGSGDVGIGDLDVTVLLPEGVHYRGGSLAAPGRSRPEPRLTGQAVTLDLGQRAGDWRETFEFEADIDGDVAGELATRAVARFRNGDGSAAQTPVAETIIRRDPATWENAGYVLGLQFDVLSDALTREDRLELDRLAAAWKGVRDIRINAVGHSDSTRISARSRQLFADNYALSRARALSAARYLAERLGVTERDIQVEGRGPDDPVASNDSEAGRRANRRVEVVLAGRRPGRQSLLAVEKGSSGEQGAETRGALPGTGSARFPGDADTHDDHLAPPEERDVPLAALSPGTGWVLPSDGFRPSIPAVRISIRHAPGQRVALFVNGLEVDAANFSGSDSDADRGVAVSRWAGVGLLEGSNQLVADITGSNGRVVDRLTRTLHYAGPPVRAELVPEESRFVADGRTRPRFAVRLLDRFGEPARHSTVGAFRVDPPYRSWWSVENDRANRLAEIGNREPLYTVGDGGIAYVELEPTTESGQAILRLGFANGREQELNAWLEPAPRDWILVGFGEGTLGYRRLSAMSEALDGADEGYYEDGRLAFFAKGRVRGDTLLTLAYDSDGGTGRSRDEFRTAVDPDAWYTLYADNAEQRFEAPSQRNLYVKIERRQFNALFGDFSTGLSTAELARYERRMNGFRSEFSGEHVAVKLFASENDQALVRDEIQGDGTSGLYRLSSAPVVAQSETVRLEVRDRFDQAEVVSSRTLSRFLDYDLDPLTGNLFFKRPVPSRDESLNPVYIVVEYETRTAAADALTAGGRTALRSADRNFEIGLTHVSENQGGDGGELSGADLQWQMTPETRFRAEVASSTQPQGGAASGGQASLVSVEHRSQRLDLRAEFREIDQDFGVGLQSRAEQGIRRAGVDGRFELTAESALRGRALMQENLETGAERVSAETALEYQTERITAAVGLTYAEDSFTDGERRSSSIVDAGVSRRLLDSALSVRANGSFGMGGELENADYLSSYVFGIDYRVLSDAELFVEYENAEGRDIDAEMTRMGVRASPWSRAQLTSSLNSEMSEFGPRLFANLGLVQGFQLNERWLLDVGLDQTRTLRGEDFRTFDDAREPAYGSSRDDFAAGYLGALYQAGDWSVNSRLEYREADSESRATLLSGWYREPVLGHGLSAGLTLFRSARDDGSELANAELRFGWARRVSESPWTWLYRADLRHERIRTAAGSDDSIWRVVSNLNANRRFGAASQLSLQYAFKFVESRFDDLTLDGYTDLVGVDYRLGLGRRFEVALHGSALHAWRAGTVDHGSGVSVGYNVADDMWLSLGYNLAGFHDEDFASSRYTAAGPFLRVTVRAHQAALKRLTGR